MNKAATTLLLLLCFPVLLFAQNTGYDESQNMKVNVTQDPFYPAGEMKMYEHVFYNIEYSQEAIAAKANGEVLLNFTVNADSTLSNFSVVKSVGYGIENGIIELMKQLKFAPGMVNGEPTNKNMLMSFPIEVE